MNVSELAMKVSELQTEMDRRFAAVDERFERVDGTLEEVRRVIKSDGDATRRYIHDEVRQLIKAEGETIRRHFDVVAEKMAGERNLALDRSMATAQQPVALTSSNAGDHVTFERRLDDHDRRLEKIDQTNDTEPEGR